MMRWCAREFSTIIRHRYSKTILYLFYLQGPSTAPEPEFPTYDTETEQQIWEMNHVFCLTSYEAHV